MYIYELPQNKQNAIKRDLTKALRREGYAGQELSELIREGMAGRLSDVDDLIITKNYLYGINAGKMAGRKAH